MVRTTSTAASTARVLQADALRGVGPRPDAPFAPVHWAMVQQPSNNHHFVVVLADGTVLDPMQDGRHTLGEWSRVLQVCGLVKP